MNSLVGFDTSCFCSYAVKVIARARLSVPSKKELLVNFFRRQNFLISWHLKNLVARNRLLMTKGILCAFLVLFTIIWSNLLILSKNIYISQASATLGPERLSEDSDEIQNLSYVSTTIDLVPLETKYQRLGGEYYSENIKVYLPAIDKVLKEKGLDNDELLIKGMFYVGQNESHWTFWRVSRFNIKGGHPTGIFQFLPGTFKSVSDGDIFNPEDQVRAFITMWERGRCDEFAVVFSCNFAPCLSSQIKDYLLRKS